MDKKTEQAAAAAGKTPGVVEKLDQLLTGPNDRAFVVCSFRDCIHNTNGECSIYTMFDVPPMKPCDKYFARAAGEGAKGEETGGTDLA